MGSGDTPRGSDFTVGALNMASEINGGTLLPRPEGHDTAAGKTPRKAKTTASQNSRFSGNKILGRKIRLNPWNYAAYENRRDTSGTFGALDPFTLRLRVDPFVFFPSNSK
jgi:hypothetical protein